MPIRPVGRTNTIGGLKPGFAAWILDGLFVCSLLSVFGLRLLPAVGQSYFVMGLVALFIGYEMLQRRETETLLGETFLLETVGVLFVVTMMVVLMTGGLDSDLFFFLYALQVVVSLLLRPRHEWLVLAIMLGILVVESGPARLLAMTTLDSLILFLKLLSLVIFSPLVLWFAARYRQNEQHEAEFEVVEAMMRTYELEDDFLAQTVSAGVFVLDAVGKVVEVNEAALRMLETTKRKITGKAMEKIIKPVASSLDEKLVDASTGWSKETRCRIARRALPRSGGGSLGEIVVLEDERIVSLMRENHPPLHSKATGVS